MMETAVTVSLIAAAASMASAVLGLLNNELARRNTAHLEETQEHIAKARADIRTLEHNTNSIKDALVKVVGEAEFARGLKVGIDAKTGPPGPQGEQGQQGEQGPKGTIF